MVKDNFLQFPFKLITKKDIQMIRMLFNKYRYTDDGFKSVKIDPFHRSLGKCIVLDYKMKNFGSYREFFDLFYLGKSIKDTSIKQILGERCINRLIELKILCCHKSNIIQSNVMVIPYKNYYFACDFIFRYKSHFNSNGAYNTDNLVYPISRDSIDLWQAVIKVKGQSVLDLGTGCGILAILASSFCSYVIGTDLNPRAVNFAQFNSLLNQAQHISFFTGDLYVSLKPDQFGLILSNPPSFISPIDNIRKLQIYAGEKGLDIIRKIIEGLPKYLKIGGCCQMVVVFFESHKNMKKELIKKWLGKYRTKFTILFLKLYEADPDQYAWIKCQDKLQFGWKVYQKTIIKLLNNLYKIGTKKIQYGILTIKREENKYFLYSEKEYINNIPLANKSVDIIKNHFL